MKKFEELTKEELYALESNEIKKYKKLVLAENGVEFPTMPKEPEKINVTPEKEVYYIEGLSGSWNEVCFESIDEARAFIDFILKLKTMGYRRYDSSVGYSTYFFENGLPRDYSDNVPTLSIRVERVFSKERFKEVKGKLITYNNEHDKYLKSMSRYNDQKEKAYDLTSFIDDRVREAIAEICKKNNYVDVFKREYLPLADGNAEMAMRFLHNTYNLSDEEKEYVLAHLDDKE